MLILLVLLRVAEVMESIPAPGGSRVHLGQVYHGINLERQTLRVTPITRNLESLINLTTCLWIVGESTWRETTHKHKSLLWY